MFKCYICGKEYNTPVEAAQCTMDCSKKQEDTARKKELGRIITDKYVELKALCEEYSNLDKSISVKVELVKQRKDRFKDTKNSETDPYGDPYGWNEAIRQLFGRTPI